LVNVFDERGELIATLCGNVQFASGSAYSAALSAFVPSASGLGGAITIFINNQPVAVWNAVGSNGQLVPNGFYHFTIIENTADGNKVVLARDAYINDQIGSAGLQFSAIPNLVHPGDQVTILASFAGSTPDSQSRIKIYDMAGELIQTLALNNSMTTWNLTNTAGQVIGTGLYFAVFDGNDPSSGNPVRKAVKIMFVH
jgi:hypothetical protein